MKIKTVKYEDLCFGDVFEIDGKFFMKANDCGYWKAVALDNDRIYDVVDGNKDSSMEFSIDEKRRICSKIKLIRQKREKEIYNRFAFENLEN